MLSRLIMATPMQSARWAFNCLNWTPSENDWQLLTSGLRADDKDEVGKFVFQKDAKRAVAGRFLIKKFVCETTGLTWKNIEILRDSENNKPYCLHLTPSGRNLHFNISHSGDFVVLAGEVGDLYLGVDLMKVEKQRTTTVPDFFRLMSRQFCPEEWAVVKSQRTETEQMSMFYRFWCLKESYVKALGTGLTLDLQKFYFKLNTPQLSQDKIITDTEVYVEGKRQIEWKFEECLINCDHIATVALNSSNVCEKYPCDGKYFKTLSFAELISHCEQISEVDYEYCRKLMAKKIKL